MIFHGYFRSSAAYRCRIAFNLKGLSPEFVAVHLRQGAQRSPDYVQLNPQGMVPTLEVDGHVLTQSLAIIEWLDEMYPAPPLLPVTPLDRAHVRALALSIACDIHPLQNLRVLGHLKTEFGQDQAGIDRWCRQWIESGLNALEAMLARDQRTGQYCFGDTPTVADICLAPQVYSAARFGADISRLANVQRIMQSCAVHPAFVAAHPSRQPDADA